MTVQTMIQWTTNLLRACALSLEICGIIATLATTHYLLLFVAVIILAFSSVVFFKTLSAFLLHHLLHHRIGNGKSKNCKNEAECHPCPKYYGRIHHICPGTAENRDKIKTEPILPSSNESETTGINSIDVKSLAQELYELMNHSSPTPALAIAEQKIRDLEHELKETKKQLEDHTSTNGQSVPRPEPKIWTNTWKPISGAAEKRGPRLSSTRSSLDPREHISRKPSRKSFQVLEPVAEIPDTPSTPHQVQDSVPQNPRWVTLRDLIVPVGPATEKIVKSEAEQKNQRSEKHIEHEVRAPHPQTTQHTVQEHSLDIHSTDIHSVRVIDVAKISNLQSASVQESKIANAANSSDTGSNISHPPQHPEEVVINAPVIAQSSYPIQAQAKNHEPKPSGSIRKSTRKSPTSPTVTSPLRSAVRKIWKDQSRSGLKVQWLDERRLEEAQAHSSYNLLSPPKKLSTQEQQSSDIQILSEIAESSAAENLSQPDATTLDHRAKVAHPHNDILTQDPESAFSADGAHNSSPTNTISVVQGIRTEDPIHQAILPASDQTQDILPAHSPNDTYVENVATRTGGLQAAGEFASIPLMLQNTEAMFRDAVPDLMESEPTSSLEIASDSAPETFLQVLSRCASSMSIDSLDIRMRDLELSSVQGSDTKLGELSEVDVAMTEFEIESTMSRTSPIQRLTSSSASRTSPPGYDANDTQGQPSCSQPTESHVSSSPSSSNEPSSSYDDAEELDAFNNLGTGHSMPLNTNPSGSATDAAMEDPDPQISPVRERMWDLLSRFLPKEQTPEESVGDENSSPPSENDSAREDASSIEETGKPGKGSTSGGGPALSGEVSTPSEGHSGDQPDLEQKKEEGEEEDGGEKGEEQKEEEDEGKVEREEEETEKEEIVQTSEESELSENMDSDYDSLSSVSFGEESILDSEDGLDSEQLSMRISEASIADIMKDPLDPEVKMRRTLHESLIKMARSALFESNQTVTQLRRVYKGVKEPEQFHRQKLRVQIDFFRLYIVERYRASKKHNRDFVECSSIEHMAALGDRKKLLKSIGDVYQTESDKLRHKPTVQVLEMIYANLDVIRRQLSDDPILSPQVEEHSYADCFHESGEEDETGNKDSFTDIEMELNSVLISIYHRLNRINDFEDDQCADPNHHIIVGELKKNLYKLENRANRCRLRLQYGCQINRQWETREIEYLEERMRELNTSEKLEHHFPICGLDEADCHPVKSESSSPTTESSEYSELSVVSYGGSEEEDREESSPVPQDVGYGILPGVRFKLTMRKALSSDSSGEIDQTGPTVGIQSNPSSSALSASNVQTANPGNLSDQILTQTPSYHPGTQLTPSIARTDPNQPFFATSFQDAGRELEIGQRDDTELFNILWTEIWDQLATESNMIAHDQNAQTLRTQFATINSLDRPWTPTIRIETFQQIKDWVEELLQAAAKAAITSNQTESPITSPVFIFGQSANPNSDPAGSEQDKATFSFDIGFKLDEDQKQHLVDAIWRALTLVIQSNQPNFFRIFASRYDLAGNLRPYGPGGRIPVPDAERRPDAEYDSDGCEISEAE